LTTTSAALRQTHRLIAPARLLPRILRPAHLAIADVFVARQFEISNHAVFGLLLWLLGRSVEQNRIG
jgi:hypothetical protein